MFARLTSTLGIIALVACAVSGCAAPDPQNAEALRLIQSFSARDASVDGIVGVPDCQNPRDMLLAAKGYPSVFQSICRVHYVLDGVNRFKDMKCNGDFDREPILSYCYVWVPYTGTNSFETP
ncbi:MAG: hypothetical protein RL378_242 [Actinomycetota bacterium]|jgi:hypothetical protein